MTLYIGIYDYKDTHRRFPRPCPKPSESGGILTSLINQYTGRNVLSFPQQTRVSPASAKIPRGSWALSVWVKCLSALCWCRPGQRSPALCTTSLALWVLPSCISLGTIQKGPNQFKSQTGVRMPQSAASASLCPSDVSSQDQNAPSCQTTSGTPAESHRSFATWPARID